MCNKVSTLLILFFFLCFCSAKVHAQDEAKWHFYSTQLGSGDSKEFLLNFNVKLESGWYIYSTEKNEAIKPTKFDFSTLNFEQKAPVAEQGDLQEVYDNTLETHLKKFAEEVTFQIPVEISDEEVLVEGEVRYMICDATECKAPKPVPFRFRLKGKKITTPIVLNDMDRPKQKVTRTKSYATTPAVVTSTIPTTTTASSIQKGNASYKVISSPRYAEETYRHSSSETIHLPSPRPIIVGSGKPTAEEKVVINDYDPSKPTVYNEDRTVKLTSSNSFVIDNVADYMVDDAPKPTTRRVVESEAKSIETKSAPSEEAILAALNKALKESQADVTVVDELTTNLLAENETKEEENELALTEEQEAELAEIIVELPKMVTSNPVNWTFDMIHEGKGVYTLIYIADVDAGWFLYGTENKGNAPAGLHILPTRSDAFEVLENAKAETTPITALDPIFKKDATKYAGQVVFKQRVKFHRNAPLSGRVTYMCGSDQQYTKQHSVDFKLNEEQKVIPANQKSSLALSGWWWLAGLCLGGVFLMFSRFFNGKEEPTSSTK